MLLKTAKEQIADNDEEGAGGKKLLHYPTICSLAALGSTFCPSPSSMNSLHEWIGQKMSALFVYHENGFQSVKSVSFRAVPCALVALSWAATFTKCSQRRQLES